MAYRQLSSGEMVQISTPWVEPGPARTALQSVRDVGVVLGHVERAHRDLLVIQAPPADPELARLAEQAGQTDGKHDTLARGTHMLLSGFAELTAEPEAASALLRLRDLLLPLGLGISTKSYREEAGEALRLQERLSPDVKQQLTAVAVGTGTLLDVVNEWIATGRLLGQLEDRRAALLQAQTTPASSVTVLQARNQWIRAATALVSFLDLVNLDEATLQLIVGSLREAERSSERRAIKRRGKASSFGGDTSAAMHATAAGDATSGDTSSGSQPH